MLSAFSLHTAFTFINRFVFLGPNINSTSVALDVSDNESLQLLQVNLFALN